MVSRNHFGVNRTPGFTKYQSINKHIDVFPQNLRAMLTGIHNEYFIQYEYKDQNCCNS